MRMAVAGVELVLLRTTLKGELMARLEQRLQPAEDLAPAAAGPARLALTPHYGGPHWRTSHVVGHCELCDTSSYWLYVKGESGKRLGRHLGRHRHTPRLD